MGFRSGRWRSSSGESAWLLELLRRLDMVEYEGLICDNENGDDGDDFNDEHASANIVLLSNAFSVVIKFML